MTNYQVKDEEKTKEEHKKLLQKYNSIKVDYRPATDKEIIVYLENKLKRIKREMKLIKKYVGEDEYNAILELESYLKNNMIETEIE